MKKYSLLLFTLLLTFACSDPNKDARVYLERAKIQYENHEFGAAKLSLDSIPIVYPKALEIQKESRQLLRQIELTEQERNLAYCDSMLIIRSEEAEKLKSGLLYEKDPEYDEIGKYMDPRMKLENNLQKSYLRSWTDEEGNLFMASVYYGSGALKHDRLKVVASDKTFAETLPIPYDGGLNYRFTDFGMTTEVVTYSPKTDNGTIMFIYGNKDKSLKAEFAGGRNYSISISNADKNALSKVVELSMALTDIATLKEEKEKAEKRIEYLQSKL